MNVDADTDNHLKTDGEKELPDSQDNDLEDTPPDAAPLAVSEPGRPDAPAPECPPPPEQLAELLAKATKAEEYREGLLRARADLENYRKRAQRERLDAVVYANAALLEKLLPTLDHFDRALVAASQTDGENIESLKTGIQMIHAQLKSALNEAGLEEIDALHQLFDPRFHEAVSQETSAEVAEGTVLRQLRKGYKLRDRLLRPASVIVARKADA